MQKFKNIYTYNFHVEVSQIFVTNYFILGQVEEKEERTDRKSAFPTEKIIHQSV